LPDIKIVIKLNTAVLFNKFNALLPWFVTLMSKCTTLGEVKSFAAFRAFGFSLEY